MLKKVRLLLVLQLILGTLNPAGARAAVGMEEILFGDIPNVVTASRREENINDAPNTMYVFTAQEIRHRGFRKLEDLLSVVPGMTVMHRDLQMVGVVRGVAPNDNEKITVMVDGNIINNLTQPEVMEGPVNFDAVERVEVIVGPGSVLYGPDTLLAIVNLITKKVEGHEVTVSAGDRGTKSHSATLSMGQKWDENRHVSFTGTYVEKAGFGYEMSDVWPRPADTVYSDYGAGKLYPSFYLNGKARFDDWTLQAISINSQLFHLDQAQDIDIDRRRYDYVNSLILNKDEHYSDSLLGTLRFNYSTKRQVWATLHSPDGGDITSSALKPGDQYDFDMYQAVFNSEYSLQHKTDNNFLQGGVQWAHKQHRHNYIMFFPADILDSTQTAVGQRVDQVNTNTIGAYVSEEFQATEKLKLVAAVRADQDSSLRSYRSRFWLSPRAAAIYRATDGWTTKLMYNTATRMPAPWNGPLDSIWGNDNAVVNTEGLQGQFGNVNPNAERPEVLRAAEWQNIFQGTKSRLAVTLFYQKLDDYITWFNPFTNAGDFEGRGAEVDFNQKLSSAVKMRLGGSFVETLIRNPLPANSFSPHHAVNGKKEMLAAPQVMANVGFDWKISAPLFFSTTARYFTKQPAGFILAGETTPTYTYFYNRIYVDAALTWENPGDRFSVQLAGRNLTDNRKPIATPQQRQTHLPRGVEGSLTVSAKF